MKANIALPISSATVALSLTACGGGDGDRGAPTQQSSNPTPPAQTVTVQGSAPAVSASSLAVILGAARLDYDKDGVGHHFRQ